MDISVYTKNYFRGNMKLLLTLNYQDRRENRRSHPKEKLLNELHAQIENSLNMGWTTNDIILATNFEHEFMGVCATVLPLNDFCLTGSKSFAIHELMKRNLVSETIWVHDLDLWQSVPLEGEPDFLEAGISTYVSPTKYNGGSLFYRPSAQDLVAEVVKEISANKEVREEPTINRVFKRDEFKDRVTVMNYRYNVGCSGFVERFQGSEQPVVGVHFHPTNRIGYDTMCRDRNRLGKIPVTNRLHQLFLKYFGETIKQYTYPDDIKINRGYGGDWTVPEHLSLDR